MDTCTCDAIAVQPNRRDRRKMQRAGLAPGAGVRMHMPGCPVARSINGEPASVRARYGYHGGRGKR
jgi:hypothetical protein